MRWRMLVSERLRVGAGKLFERMMKEQAWCCLMVPGLELPEVEEQGLIRPDWHFYCIHLASMARSLSLPPSSPIMCATLFSLITSQDLPRLCIH